MKNFSYLNVRVVRPIYDCTNNGLSSKMNSITCFDGELEAIKDYIVKSRIKADECLYVVRRELWGKPAHYLTPLNWAIEKPDGPVMFGGNYAVGDSRWKEWFGHYLPLPVHDRYETWEQYELLSN